MSRINKRKEFDSYSQEILENDLDHIVVPYHKNLHNVGTRAREGKCSRSTRCKSVTKEEKQVKYTVLERKGEQIHSIGLCRNCFEYSPFSSTESRALEPA